MCLLLVSSLSRGTWIEMPVPQRFHILYLSSLSRGTWIEIRTFWRAMPCHLVVPLTRDVDWNKEFMYYVQDFFRVVPLTRDVDWNKTPQLEGSIMKGRPSHEGRGLKFCTRRYWLQGRRSSLSRGTWIEIQSTCRKGGTGVVVPLTRDVDWNIEKCNVICGYLRSSLSRGTWIEICLKGWIIRRRHCRPSHEGRGLKWCR